VCVYVCVARYDMLAETLKVRPDELRFASSDSTATLSSGAFLFFNDFFFCMHVFVYGVCVCIYAYTYIHICVYLCLRVPFFCV